MEKTKDIKELKDYITKYVNTQYGVKKDYIKGFRATKNGLFVYGHKVYAPGYNLVYDIHTYISWYESNNYSFIQDLIDTFVNDCERLTEYKEVL